MNRKPRLSTSTARAALARQHALEPSHARPYAELALELEVHQVELEMQNEDLRVAQHDLAAARDRYLDLYDFAPVGYFTLNDKGLVTDANLTGATMLAAARNTLRGRALARFIVPEHVDRWDQHMRQALQSTESQRIELVMQKGSGETFHGQLDCRARAQTNGTTALRITLTDITQRKLAEMDRQIAQAEQDAREAERRHVARELHEGLGQRLGALKMELGSLPLKGDAAASCRDRVDGMLDALDHAMASVRRIAIDLRPLMLDDLGLGAAIEWLANDVTSRLGIGLKLDVREPATAPDERVSIALYRLAQLVLEHIGHAGAVTHVAISLAQRPDALVLAFRCKGASRAVGAAPLPQRDRLQEQRLRDRARQLGGQLEIAERPGGMPSFIATMPALRHLADSVLPERRSQSSDRRRSGAR